MKLIKNGIPSVVLVTERFTILAKASARGNGVPAAPMVILPKTELTEYVEPELVRSVAQDAIGQIVALLRESGGGSSSS